MLALLASMGGFIFGYDTGQISDILLMDDFLLRFATCSTPGVVSTCKFSVVREGLIVSLLSIGTLAGALIGAPWLAAHDRLDEAQVSLARTRGLSAAEAKEHYIIRREVEEIRSNVQYEKKTRAGWIDCFKPKNKTLYRTLLGMSLQSLQQLTGANYFFYYGATVFQAVGLADSFVTQIILGAVNFFCTFGGMYIMERFGRRRPLIFGGIWQSAWLFVFASAGTAVDPVTHPGIGKLMIVSACMFIWGYAMTWAPGVWILIGETFPTRTRAKQGSLSTAANWLWNFLLAFFTPFISSAIDYRYGYVFAACNLTGAVVVYLFLYESSDLSLESVNMMYTDPNCKPWTSRQWAPPGFSSRQDLIEQTKAAEHSKPLASGALEEEKIEKHSSTSEEV
ncbi:hypothetical protein HYDPIDRAFT_165963 [Hydnomerulius pinastri MD-312]|nr:hypothetical protein HYDPIDRAFT_165963 [Hydnomerulius pinastri MD-312]